ncbi:MAG: DMT family transporter [Firmicutes bacterium]|nr:DMT family transporter [Bacillota bacterium]
MSGEGYALLAAFAFALSTVFTRQFAVGSGGRPPVRPEVGVLVSLSTDLVLFGSLAAAELRRGAGAQLTWQSALLFMVGAVVASMLGRNLAYVSVQQAGAGRSTAIRLCNTLFAAAVGWVWLHDLPRPWQVVGALLITTGLWLVVTEREGWVEGASWMGVATAVGAAAAFALGDTARRAALHVTPSLPLGAFVGVCAALPAQLLYLRPWRWPRESLRHVWRPDVLGSGFFNTVALLLLFFAFQRTPVANAAALYNLQVLLVIVLGRWMLRGEDPGGGRLVLGSVLAVVGAGLVLWG